MQLNGKNISTVYGPGSFADLPTFVAKIAYIACLNSIPVCTNCLGFCRSDLHCFCPNDCSSYTDFCNSTLICVNFTKIIKMEFVLKEQTVMVVTKIQ